ncbi:MAG: amidase family protein [Nakamurella sp.]
MTTRSVRAGVDDAERCIRTAASIAQLHAFTQLCADVVRADAEAAPTDAALSGICYVVKDIVDAIGYATTGATPALAENSPAQRDAPVIQRMRSAGAVLVAKTNLHELSFGITSNNAAFGAVANPYDCTRIAGGSSGGSAVAVATGFVSVALAADTGGSARIPAALCGVIGFRPSTGRYPMAGVLPISPTRDTIGIVATSVRDVALLDAVLADDPPAIPATELDRDLELDRVDVAGLRVGRITSFGGPMDEAIEQAYAFAIDSWRGLGATIVDVDLADLFATGSRIGLPIALGEFRASVEEYLADAGVGVTLREIGDRIASPDVRHIWAAAVADDLDPALLADALGERDLAIAQYASRLDQAGVDVVAYPTTPVTARAIGEDETVVVAGERAGTFDTYTRFQNLGGVLGHPSITLPAGVDAQGLPIGVEIAGRRSADRQLLAIAAALTTALPTIPPPAIRVDDGVDRTEGGHR